MPNSPLEKQIRKGGSKPCKVVDILVIVVTQAEKLLYMLSIHQNRPLLDGVKLGWIYTDGADTNDVPKILNRLL